jgi:P pilus assembly chaperone PapD
MTTNKLAVVGLAALMATTATIGSAEAAYIVQGASGSCGWSNPGVALYLQNTEGYNASYTLQISIGSQPWDVRNVYVAASQTVSLNLCSIADGKFVDIYISQITAA